MKLENKIGAIYQSMRPFQWIKNLAVFAAIIFNGKLFDPLMFRNTAMAFFAFCFISSASYLVNDVVDAPYDRRHPQKRNRPIARGDVSFREAIITAFILMIIGLIIASSLGLGFIILFLTFLVVHIVYSFFLKKVAVLDILAISASFILRSLGGELATGYHLPVWLMFTVVFLSLFIASGKRRSELVLEGSKARPTLAKYSKSLLNFYTSIFSVATLISYSLFAYLSAQIRFTQPALRKFLLKNMPGLLDRKWLMLTIFPVILGIMRYSQLILERKRGQRPEKVLASDIPLLATVLLWGLMVVAIIYVL